ncbi:MAG: hypothetical protein A2007_02390 [Verrucomicrobia bacterium GWC2_42_7]|nr:MAG: hypothetical protein A2007_02390 [Verrucomicrobia bacterium GWC2_42_7]
MAQCSKVNFSGPSESIFFQKKLCSQANTSFELFYIKVGASVVDIQGVKALYFDRPPMPKRIGPMATGKLSTSTRMDLWL